MQREQLVNRGLENQRAKKASFDKPLRSIVINDDVFPSSLDTHSHYHYYSLEEGPSVKERSHDCPLNFFPSFGARGFSLGD